MLFTRVINRAVLLRKASVFLLICCGACTSTPEVTDNKLSDAGRAELGVLKRFDRAAAAAGVGEVTSEFVKADIVSHYTMMIGETKFFVRLTLNDAGSAALERTSADGFGIELLTGSYDRINKTFSVQGGSGDDFVQIDGTIDEDEVIHGQERAGQNHNDGVDDIELLPLDKKTVFGFNAIYETFPALEIRRVKDLLITGHVSTKPYIDFSNMIAPLHIILEDLDGDSLRDLAIGIQGPVKNTYEIWFYNDKNSIFYKGYYLQTMTGQSYNLREGLLEMTSDSTVDSYARINNEFIQTRRRFIKDSTVITLDISEMSDAEVQTVTCAYLGMEGYSCYDRIQFSCFHMAIPATGQLESEDQKLWNSLNNEMIGHIFEMRYGYTTDSCSEPVDGAKPFSMTVMNLLSFKEVTKGEKKPASQQ